jgi:CDP-paratose 2-epimerase
VLEALDRVEELTGRRLDWHYVEEPRNGDHICYISDLRKFQRDYPKWKITCSVDAILEKVVTAQSVHQLHVAPK